MIALFVICAVCAVAIALLVVFIINTLVDLWWKKNIQKQDGDAK